MKNGQGQGLRVGSCLALQFCVGAARCTSLMPSLIAICKRGILGLLVLLMVLLESVPRSNPNPSPNPDPNPNAVIQGSVKPQMMQTVVLMRSHGSAWVLQGVYHMGEGQFEL